MRVVFYFLFLQIPSLQTLKTSFFAAKRAPVFRSLQMAVDKYLKFTLCKFTLLRSCVVWKYLRFL